VLQAIAGYDAQDPVSIDVELPSYASALQRSTSGLKLGMPQSPYYDRLDSDVAAAIEAALSVLKDLTAEARHVELPPTAEFPVILAEAYAYHEQFLSDPANHRLYDSVTLERLLAAGEFSAASYIQTLRELAMARRAIVTAFQRSRFPAALAVPGCRSVCRSAVRHSARYPCSRSHTRMSKQPSGTRNSRHLHDIPGQDDAPFPKIYFCHCIPALRY
jgi:aspartyl-tRNA(Asn)/glutamyl-tRNA(Gln) amidotransferase subunit A